MHFQADYIAVGIMMALFAAFVVWVYRNSRKNKTTDNDEKKKGRQ